MPPGLVHCGPQSRANFRPNPQYRIHPFDTDARGVTTRRLARPNARGHDTTSAAYRHARHSLSRRDALNRSLA
jgi:hypothetical protein